jgi:tetratricopeptide (TPR) repeat protein
MSAAALAILVPLGLLATASDEESRQSSLAWMDSARGEEHLRQALLSARRRDWPAAFREIQLAHRANPSDAVACYNFGVLHFNNENYADAVPWFSKAHGHAPGRFEFQYALAAALEAAGDTDAAAQEYGRLALLYPRNAAVFQGRAWIRFRLDQYDHADNDAKRALALDPKLADAMYIRARVGEHRGDIGEAVRIYRHVIALEPAHRNALYRLTLLSRRTGDAESARRFADAFRIVKAKAEARGAILRGVRSLLKSEYGPASLEFLRAASQDERNPEAWYYLGLSRQRLGDLRGSAESFRKAIALNPEPAAPQAWLGVSLAALQDADAVKHLERASRTAGDDPEVLVTVARGYAILKDSRVAEVTLRQALQLAPAQPAALAELFQLCAAEERYQEARAIADATAQSNPADTRLLFRIGLFWAAMDDFRRARAAAEQALQADPRNESARGLLRNLPLPR